jgi:hypothetical protein
LSAAAPAKAWKVLTTVHVERWPTGYSDVLDGYDPVDGRDLRTAGVKGTPILLSSNGGTR